MIKKKFSDALQFVKERYVAKKIRKIVGSGEQGFTLLEILVVLTIMGFLIAMVAPRLAGISGDAVDTVCDSNQNRMVTYMGSYYEKMSRFPNNLTNIVEETAANVYQFPATSDDDPDNGPETVAKEFMDRNHFRIHYLTNDEAKELKKMGIVSVFNLNDYSIYNTDGTGFKEGYTAAINTATNDVPLAASVTKSPKMDKNTIPTDTVATPFAVAMIGCGATAGGLGVGSPFAALPATERGWGEADHIGRIVFGMGPESALVKDGVISNAAHCPGGIQNADNATYNDYNLILPRLEATVARMQDATAGATIDAIDNNAADGIQTTAVAYDEEPAAAYDMAAAGNLLRTRDVRIDEAQAGHNYATQCPEGHMYPEDDGEFWGVSLNGDAILD